MATASVSYTFVNGDPNDGPQVSQNFTDLVTFLNNSVVHKDGSTTMTGALVLPASDPVSANQAARKSYVDDVRTYVDNWPTHCVTARRTADLAITTGVTTAIPFTVEDRDTDGFHDNSTNNTRFTVPAGLGGLYVISAYVRFEPAATTAAVLFPRINGTGVGNTMRTVNQESTAYSSLGLTNLYLLSAGDYVELCVWHSTGSTRSVSAITTSSGVDPLTPVFSMYRIGGPSA